MFYVPTILLQDHKQIIYKDSLSEDQYIIICDFAENYSFIVPNASIGIIHRLHCTPLFIRGTQMAMRKCVISDCMDHNIVAVHTFQKVIIDFLKHKKMTVLKK